LPLLQFKRGHRRLTSSVEVLMLSFLLIPAEKILNGYLHLDPEALQLLEPMIGKVIKLSADSFVTYWIIQHDRIHLTSTYAGTVNLALSGSIFDLLMSMKHRANTRRLTIHGDFELAEYFSNLFQNLDIDWEEKLSAITGPRAAHGISLLITMIRNHLQSSQASFKQNLTDYLQEESEILVTKSELEDFFECIEHLRNDVARLSIRIQRLCTNSKK
jgi:ubiquinone biosynthesis accessory factor UbiJ